MFNSCLYIYSYYDIVITLQDFSSCILNLFWLMTSLETSCWTFCEVRGKTSWPFTAFLGQLQAKGRQGSYAHLMRSLLTCQTHTHHHQIPVSGPNLLVFFFPSIHWKSISYISNYVDFWSMLAFYACILTWCPLTICKVNYII